MIRKGSLAVFIISELFRDEEQGRENLALTKNQITVKKYTHVCAFSCLLNGKQKTQRK